MRIIELVEFVNNSKNKMLKEAQLAELISKKLEVKKYLSIKDKKALVESIVDECILYDNGIFKFDEIDKYICFTMRTIEAYTNLELSYDIEEDYDLLCQNDLLNMLVNIFNGEYENVKILLQMRCDYILNENNIELQIGKFLTSLLDKIDNITNVLSNKIDNFDFNNLPIEVDDLSKLLELINKNK